MEKEKRKTHSKVSVLIPVYNVEKYVRRCIDSVLNQTMQEGVEVIIVNDCTPDGSMEKIFEALRAYEESHAEGERVSVRVVVHDTNRGQVAARNTAMSYATGDYVTFIDSDDWVEPSIFEDMYRRAVKENADIVTANYWQDTELSVGKECFQCLGRDPLEALLFIRVRACLWSKLFRRSLFTNSGLHQHFSVTLGEDFIMTVQLFCKATKIIHLPKAYYHYIVRGGSMSHTVSTINMQSLLYLQRFTIGYFKEKVIYDKYLAGIAFRIIYWQFELLLATKGKAQRQLLRNYRELLSPAAIIKYGKGIGRGRQVAMVFAQAGMLPVYNLLRWVNYVMKGKRPILFNQKIEEL